MINKDTDWTFPSTFEEMEERFPNIVRDMAGCQQNPKYHGEGDVWSHTKMVINSMRGEPLWQGLPKLYQDIMIAACFFHDIAKPKTSTVEDGVIRSNKHSTLGARMIRETLWNSTLEDYYETPWDIREYLANLTMLHMLPYHFVDKENPSYFVGASSYVVSNRLLALLGIADTKGRICEEDRNDRLGLEVDLFQDFCEEENCWESPMPFNSDNARFRYFFEHKGDPSFDYPEPEKGTVILMSGLQGSGKDYTISKHYADIPMIGYDSIRKDKGLKFGKDESAVQNALKEQTKVFMRDGQDFVFNATNTIKNIRATWIRRFRKYGYRIKIHYIEKSMEETLSNNKSRKDTVPDGIIFEKFSRLDIPTLLECHEMEMDV